MPKQQQTTRSGRPNLRMVAEHIRLSPATVSLALRGDASIPPETRERVLAAAEELNYEYVPRGKKPERLSIKRIAFVMHDHGDKPVTANPFYGHILSSAEQACREKQISLSFVIVNHGHQLSEMLPPVITHDVDGLLLASPYSTSLVKRIDRESECPIVLIDNVFPGSPYDSIMADDFGGAYLAVTHLIGQGHAHIAMLAGYARDMEMIPSFRERFRGYSAACADAGLTPRPAIIMPTKIPPHPKLSMDVMTQWVEELLRTHPDVTAFFMVADRFALACMLALAELGVEVPNDLSVIGFDNIPQAKFSEPPLTTIHSHRSRMAELAVELLLDRIHGLDAPPQSINVGTRLVQRESTGPVPR